MSQYWMSLFMWGFFPLLLLLLLLLSRISRVRLCDPTDSSPPGSSIPGILQARILEWVAISFSNAGKWKVKVKPLSRVQLFATQWTAAYQAPPPMGFSRQEYWSGVPLPSPMNIGVRAFFQTIVFFGYVPRTEIAGSYGNTTCGFLRNLHTVLHSGYTNLHSHQEFCFLHALSRTCYFNSLS